MVHNYTQTSFSVKSTMFTGYIKELANIFNIFLCTLNFHVSDLIVEHVYKCIKDFVDF